MSKKIYVGNMSYSTTEDQLREAFAEYGEVVSVNIVMDRMTNRSKGFGFIEMEDADNAKDAISSLNNTELNGREIKVNEAKDRAPRNSNYRN